MKRIMVGATVVVVLVLSLAAGMAYGQRPTAATTTTPTPTTTTEKPAPPPNDNYLASTIIPAAQTTGTGIARYHDVENITNATTQGELFNPEQNGLKLSGGGREPLTCEGHRYGRTIWYDLHPKSPEGVQLQVTGIPNVIVVYEWSLKTAKITRRVGCQVQNSGAPNTYTLPSELMPSKDDAYTVQIGALDTTTTGGSLNFTAVFVPDHDGDGIYDSQDACPSLAGVRQFGGCPPTLNPILHYAASAASGKLTLSQVSVAPVPGATKVTARCSCGLSETVSVGAHATKVPLSRFSKAKIRFGSTVQVWVTVPAHGDGTYKYGAIGAYQQYKAGPDGLGEPVKKCLLPGSMTPRSQCRSGSAKHA